MATNGWNNIAAPNFSTAAGLMGVAGQNIDGMFDSVVAGLKAKRARDERNASRPVQADMLRVNTEGQVDPFLEAIKLNPKMWSDELMAQAQGLRGGALGYDKQRAAIGASRAAAGASGARAAALNSANNRAQTDWERGIAKENALANPDLVNAGVRSGFLAHEGLGAESAIIASGGSLGETVTPSIPLNPGVNKTIDVLAPGVSQKAYDLNKQFGNIDFSGNGVLNVNDTMKQIELNRDQGNENITTRSAVESEQAATAAKLLENDKTRYGFDRTILGDKGADAAAALERQEIADAKDLVAWASKGSGSDDETRNRLLNSGESYGVIQRAIARIGEVSNNYVSPETGLRVSEVAGNGSFSAMQETYGAALNQAGTSQPTVHYNNLVESAVSADDTVSWLKEQLPGLGMTDPSIVTSINEVMKRTGVGPEEAAAALTLSTYKEGVFGAADFDGVGVGALNVDVDKAVEALGIARDPANQKAAALVSQNVKNLRAEMDKLSETREQLVAIAELKEQSRPGSGKATFESINAIDEKMRNLGSRVNELTGAKDEPTPEDPPAEEEPPVKGSAEAMRQIREEAKAAYQGGSDNGTNRYVNDDGVTIGKPIGEYGDPDKDAYTPTPANVVANINGQPVTQEQLDTLPPREKARIESQIAIEEVLVKLFPDVIQILNTPNVSKQDKAAAVSKVLMVIESRNLKVSEPALNGLKKIAGQR